MKEQNNIVSLDKYRKYKENKLKPQNILQTLPNAKIRLYGYSIYGFDFFNTRKELDLYLKKEKINYDICIVEYLGTVFGRQDVIRVIEKSGIRYMTMCDEYGFGIYDFEKSQLDNKHVWVYNYGSLKNIYKAFKSRGIILEDDIYEQIENQNKNILKYCREHNLFNMGNKE